ncbi:MAG: hypothetical protein HQ523_07970 [Lentisphaerae bacterium]|nr:hypothetical protein [Lentisphaerota bacterium]
MSAHDTQARTWGLKGWIALVLGAGILAHINGLRGVMLFDDTSGIVANTALRHLPDAVLGSSRPLTQLTFHLNILLGGLNPLGFHLVNLALHLANGVLLVLVLDALLSALGSMVVATRQRVAGLTALLWTVHPLTTESVTYIVQRAESLAAFCLLLTLFLFLRLRDGAPTSRRSVMLVACAAGMLAKPVMVVAPLLVLCIDRILTGTSLRDVLKQRSHLHGLLLATMLIVVTLALVPNESSSSVGLGGDLLAPWQYALTQTRVFVHYIRLAVVPWPLCLDYMWPASSVVAAIPSMAVVLLLLAGWVILWWKHHPLALVGCWVGLLLAPTSSVLPLADAAAEHRMYLPLVGLLVLPLLAGEQGVAALLRRGTSARRVAIVRVALRWMAIVTVAALMALTIHRNRDYASTERMWERVATVAPWNLRARVGLGCALYERGKLDQAEALFTDVAETLERQPLARGTMAATLASLARMHLGTLYLWRGDPTRAAAEFRLAVQHAPANGGGQKGLREAQRRLGE